MPALERVRLGLSACVALVIALAAAPVSAQLEEARGFYEEAEFDQALAALDRAAAGEGLDLSGAVALLELRAELHLALGDAAAVDHDMVQLATLAPDHVLDPHHPPELQESLTRARAAAGQPLALHVETTPSEGRLALDASVVGDPGHVVREIRIEHRQDGGAWEAGGASVEIAGGASVEVVVSAIGPGGAVLTAEGTHDAPRSYAIPAAAVAAPSAADPWPFIGIGIGVGVAVIIGIIVGVVVATTPSESDRTQPGLPMISPLTVRF
jgi:hypothetical protein